MLPFPSVPPEPSLFPSLAPHPQPCCWSALANPCYRLEKVPKLLTQKEKKKKERKMLLICMLTYIYLHVH